MSNPKVRRDFFKFMDDNDVGYRRAAEALGVNPNTARSWAYRARKEGKLKAYPPGRPSKSAPTPVPKVVTPPAPAPLPRKVHPADIPKVQALREELEGALHALDLCERAESWQAAISHRKFVRVLRKELRAAIQQEQLLTPPSTETSAREIIQWMTADKAMRVLVLGAFGAA